ncbi:MAG: hypothetical protein RIC03_00045 [Cyclobacteriaceae bacterium]
MYFLIVIFNAPQRSDMASGHILFKEHNVVKLPNHHNSIHEELHRASQNPERRKWLEAQKLA